MSALHTHDHRRTWNELRALIAFGLVCVLASMSLTVGAAGARDAEVSVHARVNPSVAVTFTDGGVVVRANTPWRLEVSVPEQPVAVRHTGSPTGGTYVPLPAGASGLSVVPEG